MRIHSDNSGREAGGRKTRLVWSHPSHITQTLTPFLLGIVWKDRALLCNVGKSQNTGKATGSDSEGVCVGGGCEMQMCYELLSDAEAVSKLSADETQTHKKGIF